MPAAVCVITLHFTPNIHFPLEYAINPNRNLLSTFRIIQYLRIWMGKMYTLNVYGIVNRCLTQIEQHLEKNFGEFWGTNDEMTTITTIFPWVNKSGYLWGKPFDVSFGYFVKWVIGIHITLYIWNTADNHPENTFWKNFFDVRWRVPIVYSI